MHAFTGTPGYDSKFNFQTDQEPVGPELVWCFEVLFAEVNAVVPVEDLGAGGEEVATAEQNVLEEITLIIFENISIKIIR